MAGPGEYGLSYDPSASARPPALTDEGLPTRPYATPDQLGGATPRGQEFDTGRAGETDPGRTASIRNNQDPGLSLSSQQFRAQVPVGVRPTSVLQPIMRNPGGNGMSAGDAARRMVDGTYLGSINATSASSFKPSAMLRLATGQDSI